MGKNQGDLGFGDEFLDTTSKKKSIHERNKK